MLLRAEGSFLVGLIVLVIAGSSTEGGNRLLPRVCFSDSKIPISTERR
jgi:hypothetical protein